METVVIERVGGIVTITMNRPEKRNAITHPMVECLQGALEEIDGRAEDRVLVLTGAGGSFCAGADLSDPDGPWNRSESSALDAVRGFGALAATLHRLSKPTIAKVDGSAVGAGLGLVLACDLVAASDRSSFSMIFTRRALSPDAGTSWLLPRIVGMTRAKELALLGDIIGADRASTLGIVSEVVALEELDGLVSRWAQRLACGPFLALQRTKKLVDGAWSSSLEEAIEHEARSQAANLAGDDVKEALAAFSQRREPRFGGG